MGMNNYYEKLTELFNEMKAQFEQLNTLQSAFDKRVSALYHELEKAGDLDVAEGHAFAETLQDTLRRRRVVKQEIALMLPTYLTLKDQIGKIEEHHTRALRKTFEIKDSLNVTMELSDVLQAIDM
jgi:hypothetical protein